LHEHVLLGVPGIVARHARVSALIVRCCGRRQFELLPIVHVSTGRFTQFLAVL
jgi:hypothetical protein